MGTNELYMNEHCHHGWNQELKYNAVIGRIYVMNGSNMHCLYADWDGSVKFTSGNQHCKSYKRDQQWKLVDSD